MVCWVESQHGQKTDLETTVFYHFVLSVINSFFTFLWLLAKLPWRSVCPSCAKANKRRGAGYVADDNQKAWRAGKWQWEPK